MSMERMFPENDTVYERIRSRNPRIPKLATRPPFACTSQYIALVLARPPQGLPQRMFFGPVLRVLRKE